VKEVRQMVARTLLVGVYKYYETWVQKYRNSGDETVNDKIENHLSPIDEPNLIPPSDRDISIYNSKGPERYFEAFIRSYEAKRFIEVIGWDKLADIFHSFEVGSNLETIKKSEEQSGGAGGEFFLCTFDKKYFIKTMTKKELVTFRGALHDYATHLTSGEGTFITKIVGVFSFRFAEGVKKTRLFVMENVFGTEKALINRAYDLKGSLHNRQVLIQSREQLMRLKATKIKETLKDIDFNNIDFCLKLAPEDRKYVLNLIERDVRFFKDAGLIDYSLLLGIIEVGDLSTEDISRLERLVTMKRAFYTENRAMCVIPGIIDFFQLFTWGKRMEKYLKKAKKMQWGLDTSAQAPGYYGDRFVAYMKVVFC